jgi:hypothetical protein
VPGVRRGDPDAPEADAAAAVALVYGQCVFTPRGPGLATATTSATFFTARALLARCAATYRTGK